MKLRKYQQEAVEAVWQALRRGEHPVVSMATGSGKSLVIADLCHRIRANGGRVLIATHVAELVMQNSLEFKALTGIEPGVLCAGLERTDKGHDVLFASVQSLYGPAKRGEIEPFNLIIVDECHLCAERDSDAKFYPTAFSSFPDAYRVGLSATPFRTDGPVWGDGKYFTDLCYETDILELVREGFLSPLIGVNANITLDTKKIKLVAGEFDQRSVEELETDSWLRAVVESVQELASGRKHIAVFCPTVATAERAAEVFTEAGLTASVVVGDTEDRTGRLDAWKAGAFPVMCSVNVLSTGFNFKALDCIVCIRPTTSLSFWQQMLGRGTRTIKGKKNCLVIDYSGNLALHGGICVGMEDSYRETKSGKVTKVSPKPRPGIVRKTKTVDEVTDLDPMLASPSGMEGLVRNIVYIVISSKSIEGKQLLMVAYECQIEGGALISANQFICVEYDGWARKKAEEWFALRGVQAPYTAERAKVMCWGLPEPRTLTIRKKGKYAEVLKEHF